ncbi:MAG: GntR family transcriptional regulator [Patescibacteria group bacterium]
MAETGRQPKYTKIKEALMDGLRSGRYPVGGVIPTETELMQQFGASRFTVRQALTELVNEGWLRREQGRGTFFCPTPARDQGERRTIALLSPAINTYIFPEIVRGIDEIAQEAGYQLVLAHSNHSFRQEGRVLQRLKENGVRGIVVEPTMSALPNPNLDQFRALIDAGTPVVFLDADPGLPAPAIVLQDEEGGYTAAKYLLGLGHRRIAMVYKEVHLPAVNRYRGYQRALEEAGVPLDQALVRSFREPESKVPAGYLQTKELLALGPRRPTAIFYYNDETAVDGYRAIWEAGLSIPEDVSVVGFDDSVLAHLHPVRLTSLVHPKQDAGRLAASLLLGQIQGKIANEGRKIYPYLPELVVRSSTGPPAGLGEYGRSQAGR